jgi:hypothetical protein
MEEKIRKGSLEKWRKNKKVGVPCGKGSSIEVTEVIRDFIEKVILEHGIKSISDAACGDYTWMSLVNKHGASYIGYDINDVMIKSLDYEDASFEVFDITSGVLPKTDLIICRDCLFHLTTDDGVKAINNFKKSGTRFLMSTTFDFIDKNVQLDKMSQTKKYGFRRINLQIPPYNLGEPVDRVYESVWNRYFCLWEIN